ncbi:hypothetical protein FRB96_002797 [Tulasnella sp. 330]|nr:hypothetical protein FRB96_002797 [Tulasnella sp. 330]KAG8877959.1 hypothetical protein FRB97_002884 [Tulasnella sp. 331]KAG8883231.1 hypothetical protein FRB98_003208 [Tulasnella sp. 332]
MPSTAPYGTWNSPIGADLIIKKNVSIAEVHVDPITKTIYHSEGRPEEGGRIVPVNTRIGSDVFGKGWNARTGVNEYGGAAVDVYNGVIYFTDFKSSRLYIIGKDGNPEAVSPDNANHRFGDFVTHPTHSHLIVSILEDHTIDEPAKVVTTLVVINAKTQAVTTIAQGADFYSTPRFSPDGKKLSWILWNHPNMPWEESELVLAELLVGDGDKVEAKQPTVIAGEGGKESITQAQWATNDVLVFFSDKNGFYNPWKYDLRSKTANSILQTPADEEYASPAWFLGTSDNAVMDASTLLVSPTKQGLALLDVNTGTLARIQSPFVSLSSIHSVSDTQAVFVGVKDDTAAALILLTLPSPASSCLTSSTIQAQFETLKSTSDLASTLTPALFPIHQQVTLTVEPDNEPLYVLYYPPTNPDYTGGKDNELPPCVLNIHGGPTSEAHPGLDWVTTYFTSRGWAWANVNYGGSSGYGRTYRDRLRGNWGIVDVSDSAAAVEGLGKKSLIDTQRVAIRGGSAGGFTTLAALVNKPKAFTAGTSSYGISDLTMLAKDTHKFESTYIDKLVGGSLAEVPDVYKERSPVNHAENIVAPLLILQGALDAVVPPSQAEVIVAKIKERGGQVEYKLYDGEGHGWRKAETVKDALEREEAFYKKVFDLK